MKFIVEFADHESMAHKRQEHMAQHLEFLEKHKDEIICAGPTFEPNSGDGAGGMWLVEAESAERVQVLIEFDPLFSTGLRKEIKVKEWRPVFENGCRLI